jgi:hypothetical protein
MFSDDLKVVADAAALKARTIIAERYENKTKPYQLYFHVNSHTDVVCSRAVALCKAMELSDWEIVLAITAACFHDVAQKWSEVYANGFLMRDRWIDESEAASAEEAFDFMSSVHDVQFMPQDMEIVGAAIIATIPRWSEEHQTTIQPYLDNESHRVVRAVALADLGSAGMDPDRFLQEGPLLFAENNIGIMQELADVKVVSDLDLKRQSVLREHYVAWLESQVAFAKGRKALLDSELDGLDLKAKAKIKALFCHFDESIALAEAAVTQAMTIDFVQLMRQLQLDVFPDERTLRVVK